MERLTKCNLNPKSQQLADSTKMIRRPLASKSSAFNNPAASSQRSLTTARSDTYLSNFVSDWHPVCPRIFDETSKHYSSWQSSGMKVSYILSMFLYEIFNDIINCTKHKTFMHFPVGSFRKKSYTFL